ncbi:hypothetical protein ACF0H5_022882 [Mactra antiquata]
MTSRWCTFVVVLFSCWLLACCQNMYPVNRGGGASGSGVNMHIDGTPDTPKLTMDIVCFKDSNDLYLNFGVYQADLNFKYSDYGDDDGDVVEYEACYFIDDADVDTDDIDDSTGCDDFQDNGPIDDTNSALSTATRTFNKSVTIDINTVTKCGASRDVDDNLHFSVLCKRDKDYDKQFDYLFRVEVSSDDCQVNTIEYSYTIGIMPFVEVKRRHEVTFNAYKGSVNTRADGPKAQDNDPPVVNLDGTKIVLGETMFLEACLGLPDVDSDNGHKEFFTENGHFPLGIYFKRCTVKPLSNPAPGSYPPVELLDEGCGTASKGARNWDTDKYVVRYVKDDDDDFEDWRRPHNCFRTLPFEANSFMRTDIFDPSIQSYECDIEYCFSSDDIRCFGTKTSEGVGYPTCPNARKKRWTNKEIIQRPHGYPTKIRTKISISPEKSAAASEPVNDKDKSDVCTELMELVSTTSILSAILLVVIIIASMMVVNIKSLTSQMTYDVEKINKMVGTQNVG